MLVPSHKPRKLKVWEEGHRVEGSELRFKRALSNRWEVSSDVSSLGNALIHAAVEVAQHACSIHALHVREACMLQTRQRAGR